MTVNGADIVSYARQQLGEPYVWGAEGPDRFDCSGLVDYVYKHFGLSTPRTTAQMQAGAGGLQTIQESDLMPGDLILSKGWSSPNQGHVGIYMGDGKLIEAGSKGVQISTFGPTYHAHTTGYRRVPGMPGYGGGSVPIGATVGGSGSGGGDWLSGLKAFIAGVVGGVQQGTQGIPLVGTLTEAVGSVATAAVGIAEGIAVFASIANRILLPTNIMRGFLMLWGTIFILIGIWFLASEAKQS